MEVLAVIGTQKPDSPCVEVGVGSERRNHLLRRSQSTAVEPEPKHDRVALLRTRRRLSENFAEVGLERVVPPVGDHHAGLLGRRVRRLLNDNSYVAEREAPSPDAARR
jgi:hypothetical protein